MLSGLVSLGWPGLSVLRAGVEHVLCMGYDGCMAGAWTSAELSESSVIGRADNWGYVSLGVE